MQNQIPKNWQKVKLGDISSLITKGTTPTTIGGKFTDEGINFIKVESITEDGKFISDKFDHIDEETNKLLGRSIVNDNDILYSIAGAIGRVALVTKTELPANTNQALAIIRLDTTRVNPKYLFYVLSTSYQKKFANNVVAQSVQANINLQQVGGFEIELPLLSEQSKIASILSAFDDKIELNNKIAKTLEEMAQALFKEWFVRFRFPGYEKAEFVDSEFGKIPKGWISADFSNIASLGRETINPNLNKTEEFLHYSLPAFDNSQEPVIESGNDIKSNKFLLPDHCVLISKLNPHIPRLWLVDDVHKYRKVSSTEFLVIIPLKEFFLYFIYTFLKSNYFQNTFKTRTTGTSTSHQRVRPHDLLNIPLVLPPDDMIRNFHSTVLNNFILSQNIMLENQKLATLRDLLLPKLMRGEIRV